MAIFRLKAIIPLTLLLALFALGFVVFSDRMVKNAVVDMGEEIVGARVDIAEVDLDLGDGRVRLVGLQAANPNSPMRNLVEAQEIIADIKVKSLLKKKVIIEQAAVRGMRFGTARTTSGALDNPSPSSGQLIRDLSAWADRIRIPPLNLDALRSVVNLDGIAAESLQTLRQARALVMFADSSRQQWEAELNRLNPRPLIDSARGIVQRLNTANPATLGVTGVAQLAGSARTTLTAVTDMRAQIGQLDSAVGRGMVQFNQNLRGLADARTADYRYAMGLLRLPGLDSPDFSASIFGDMAVARLQPLLYWVNRAARYLPPGLDPRRHTGPKRPRRAGVTVRFPDPNEEPDFLVEQAEVTLEIGGAGAAAGAYGARVTGLTTEPAVYGKPLIASVERTAAAVGPTDIRVNALLNRTGVDIRDSADVAVRGIPLPTINLASLGARLDMGRGATDLWLTRRGDSVVGRWSWRSTDVTWSRMGQAPDTATATGTRQRVERFARDFLWETVSALNQVEIDVRFSGSPRGPSIRIASNVGRLAAESVRRQLGEEIARAERAVRARVDSLVGTAVARASERVNALETEVAERVGLRREELTVVRQELERAIGRLVTRP